MKVANEEDCQPNFVFLFADGSTDYRFLKKVLNRFKSFKCDSCIYLMSVKESENLFKNADPKISVPHGLEYVSLALKLILSYKFYPKAHLVFFLDREHWTNDYQDRFRKKYGIVCIEIKSEEKVIQLECSLSNYNRRATIAIVGRRFCLEDELLSYYEEMNENMNSCDDYKKIFNEKKKEIENNEKVLQNFSIISLNQFYKVD